MHPPHIFSVICFAYFICTFQRSTWAIEIETSAPDATTPPPKPHLPIDEDALQYISSSLSYSECQDLYGFLVMQETSQKLNKLMNVEKMQKYTAYLKRVQGRLDEDDQMVFNCSASLHYWNSHVIGERSDWGIDTNVPEIIMKVSLSTIGRDDLEQWLSSYLKLAKQERLEKLKKEIESHTDPQWSGVSRVVLTFDDTSEDASQFTKVVIGLFLLAFTIFGTICIFVTCLCDPKLESKCHLHNKSKQSYQQLKNNDPKLGEVPATTNQGVTVDLDDNMKTPLLDSQVV